MYRLLGDDLIKKLNTIDEAIFYGQKNFTEWSILDNGSVTFFDWIDRKNNTKRTQNDTR